MRVVLRDCFLIFLFICLSFGALAQSRTINGYVRDESSGESLIGASIFDSRQDKITVTNNFGFYSITTRRDSAVLTFSFVGYEPRKIIVPMKHDTSIVVLLRSNKILDEVVVTAARTETITESTRMGSVNVSTEQVKAVPAFAGEIDVLKALQLLPGVSGGQEGQSNLVIRGGNPDQTLILMDGAPVYNPTHMYGFFSTFNADAVNNIELVKGGFPARYGGRLSGVVDVTLKEGNMNKLAGEASLGLVASKFTLEAPIVKNKTSFIVSGRRGYMDLIGGALAARLPAYTYVDIYNFYDLNAKLNHRINAHNRVYVSAYKGHDYGAFPYSNYSVDSIDHRVRTTTTKSFSSVAWGNSVANVRWNHEINKKFFFNLTAYYTQYDLNQKYDTHTSEVYSKVFPDTVNSYYAYNYRSRIRDFGTKLDFDLIPNLNHYIRFGLAGIQHRFTPGVGAVLTNDPNYQLTPAVSETSPTELNGYIEDDFSISPSTKLNLGVYGVAYKTGEKTRYSAQPRFAIRQNVGRDVSLKASYSYMQQYLFMLSNSSGTPTDFWVPVTENVRPQVSQQVSIGAAKIIRQFEVSLEGYYKKMENLLEYKEGLSYLDTNEPWENKVEVGHGKAYGAEILVQKKTGRLTGWVGYTLSWNKRLFDNLNHGNWFYYRYDHRHDFKTTWRYEINRHWDASATFIYTTGNAITLPLQMAPFMSYPSIPNNPQASYSPTFEARNNLRLPAYHRLDVSATYKFQTQRFQHRVTAAVYNAYDRLNPYYAEVDYSLRQTPLIKTVALFPILPSITYSIKF